MTNEKFKGRLRYHHLYNTPRWRALRRIQLAKEPLCLFCQAKGIVEQATVVDHIRRHKGDTVAFYNPNNLQSLCKLCHDREKKILENREEYHPINPNGWPTDPSHHFNLKK